ncbi:hypothetical protein N9R81_05000 [Flavobacteriales bacterium]|nr:hypothetical protein [Flavobacteriales bacterium]
MKQAVLFSILLANLAYHSDAQKVDKQLQFLEKYEDSLATLRDYTLFTKSNEKRNEYNTAFLEVFKEVLSQDASYEFNFDEIPALGDLRSPDNTFRMLTWNVPSNKRTHTYYCLLQVHQKNSKDYSLFELEDKSAEITRPLNKLLTSSKWYGALYSEIIPFKRNGKTQYIILGWDGNDEFTNKKIIEVLSFTKDNKPKFGAQVFKLSKGAPRRLIFEYAEEVTMSLRWEPKRKQIVFDHLSPTKEELKGIRQYYVPDMSFDAIELQKGTWVYLRDVDVRVKKGKYDQQYNTPTPPNLGSDIE